MVADLAVFPCGPTAADAWALAAAVEVFQEARALREELRGCVLITRKQGRTALGKGARPVLETWDESGKKYLPPDRLKETVILRVPAR